MPTRLHVLTATSIHSWPNTTGLRALPCWSRSRRRAALRQPKKLNVIPQGMRRIVLIFRTV